METNQPNIFERLNNWIKESVTIKLMSIGILILILMIPSSWIESLIYERQSRAESVINEIAGKWSGEQTITGPVLVIPFTKREKIDKGKDGIEIREWEEKAFFLPEQLTVNSKVDPQILHRGIFDAAVYESQIALSSAFSKPDFKKLGIEEKDVLWNDAHLVMGITDLRGISKNPTLMLGIVALPCEPSSQIGLSTQYSNQATTDGYDNSATAAVAYPPSAVFENGIIADLNWEKPEDFSKDVSIKLGLKGSTLLYFVPVGKTTHVKLEGPWASPSFAGNFLPSSRDVSETGFKASWDVLHYNRPFSQQWVGEGQKISGSEFGVKLLIPVDQYQKSMRTAKYSKLIILLTFIALFMVEILRKVRIHPFQYILVGAALIIYYSLLLSFSEHVGYNWAYMVASLATVILVSLYSITFLDSKKLVMIFSFLMAFFYTFIFVIIQLQDYSLLLGSIGLFLIIGLIMYSSKNIRWYKEEKSIE
jgi:inner membrane protein